MPVMDPRLVAELYNVTSMAIKPQLFLVEWDYDIEFLTILSDRLHAASVCGPSLSSLVAAEKLLFIPTGGASPSL